MVDPTIRREFRFHFPSSIRSSISDRKIAFNRVKEGCKIAIIISPLSSVIYNRVSRPFLLFIFSFDSHFLLFTDAAADISDPSIDLSRKRVSLHAIQNRARNAENTFDPALLFPYSSFYPTNERINNLSTTYDRLIPSFFPVTSG